MGSLYVTLSQVISPLFELPTAHLEFSLERPILCYQTMLIKVAVSFFMCVLLCMERRRDGHHRANRLKWGYHETSLDISRTGWWTLGLVGWAVAEPVRYHFDAVTATFSPAYVVFVPLANSYSSFKAEYWRLLFFESSQDYSSPWHSQITVFEIRHLVSIWNKAWHSVWIWNKAFGLNGFWDHF